MKPGTFNLEFTRGDDYSARLRVRSAPGVYLDLTGWTGKCQIRETEDAATAVDATVRIDPDQVTNKGVAWLELTSVQTATLGNGWVHDVELVDTLGKRHTYLAGKTKMKKDVTR